MIFIDEVHAKKVFCQEGVLASYGENVPLGLVLDDIQSCRYQEQIEKIRQFIQQGRIVEAGKIKKNLPAVTFSASYNKKRASGNEIEYNYICVIDLDHIDKSKFTDIIEQLAEDKYLIALWVSPSGDGLKGIIPIRYELSLCISRLQSFHRTAFRMISEYLFEQYKVEIDKSGKDITRLCFVSADKALIRKPQAEEFSIPAYEVDKDYKPITESKKYLLIDGHSSGQAAFTVNRAWLNAKNKNDANNRKRLASILKYLYKRSLSITSTYDEWFHVAYALVNTFTFDLGYKYFCQLSKLDIDKYDENNCSRFFIYCYAHSQNQITFATIVYYAQNTGYQIGGD